MHFFNSFILFLHACYMYVCLRLVAFVREHMWHKAFLMGYSMRLELTLDSSINDLWLVKLVYIGVVVPLSWCVFTFVDFTHFESWYQIYIKYQRRVKQTKVKTEEQRPLYKPAWPTKGHFYWKQEWVQVIYIYIYISTFMVYFMPKISLKNNNNGTIQPITGRTRGGVHIFPNGKGFCSKVNVIARQESRTRLLRTCSPST